MLNRRLTGTPLEAHCGIELMGVEFVVTAEARVTSWGYPQTWEQPAEGAEWEIDKITLERDEPGALGPAFEATGALFDLLCEDIRLIEGLDEAVADYEAPDYNDRD